MDKTKEPGYVYILTNPSFREDWVKIGKSSRPVDVRSKELDNTAVPLRIRQNREFFNVAPQIALDIFYDIAKMIEDAVVTVYKDNKPVTNNEKPDEHVDDHKRIVRRGRFKFSMVGIKIGECITFMPTYAHKYRGKSCQ